MNNLPLGFKKLVHYGARQAPLYTPDYAFEAVTIINDLVAALEVYEKFEIMNTETGIARKALKNYREWE